MSNTDKTVDRLKAALLKRDQELTCAHTPEGLFLRIELIFSNHADTDTDLTKKLREEPRFSQRIKGRHVLFLIRHLSFYSVRSFRSLVCDEGEIKSTYKEKDPLLLKKRNGYFVTVNQFIMTTIIFRDDYVNIGAMYLCSSKFRVSS